MLKPGQDQSVSQSRPRELEVKTGMAVTESAVSRYNLVALEWSFVRLFTQWVTCCRHVESSLSILECFERQAREISFSSN